MVGNELVCCLCMLQALAVNGLLLSDNPLKCFDEETLCAVTRRCVSQRPSLPTRRCCTPMRKKLIILRLAKWGTRALGPALHCCAVLKKPRCVVQSHGDSPQTQPSPPCADSLRPRASLPHRQRSRATRLPASLAGLVSIATRERLSKPDAPPVGCSPPPLPSPASLGEPPPLPHLPPRARGLLLRRIAPDKGVQWLPEYPWRQAPPLHLHGGNGSGPKDRACATLVQWRPRLLLHGGLPE